MGFFSAWRRELVSADTGRDAVTAAFVLLSAGAFRLGVQYVGALRYLEVFGAPILKYTAWACLTFWVARWIARAVASLNPARLRVVHRLAAPSNCTAFFVSGLLLAAVGTLPIVYSEVLPLPTWKIVLWHVIWIVFILVFEWTSKFPFLPSGAAGARDASADTEEESPGSWASLGWAVGVAFALVIGGEALITQFTPWKFYSQDDFRQPPLAKVLPDGTGADFSAAVSGSGTVYADAS